MTTRFADAQGRRNNFDFLRFVLACTVIFSHSFPLVRGSNASEPLSRATRGQLTFGELAVDWFFVISGYLIAKSWVRSAGLGQYLEKRVLRIYPAFIVATLIGAFVVTPIASDGSHPPFSLGEIGRTLFQCVNLEGFPRRSPGPQVFVHNPIPLALNGSTWSIRYEFCCYLLVAALGMLGLLTRRTYLVAVAFALMLAAHVCGIQPRWRGWLTVATGWGPWWPRLLAYYLAGVVFYLYRQRIPDSWGVALLAAAALLASARVPGAVAFTLPVFGTYLLFRFAFSPAIRLGNFARRGDFSYGIYLYAFPIEQLLVMRWGPSLNPLGLFLVATPLAVAAGAVSYHLVERPFLRLKPRPEPQSFQPVPPA